MYLLRTMYLLLVLTALTPQTQAQTSDPDFQTAVDAWLQDNDAVALPLLSRLAKAGNEDAMILLGVLERLPGKLSPYMVSLSRKERNELLRAPGGLSGKSWLTKVVVQKELAQALMDKDHVFLRATATLRLLEQNAVSVFVDVFNAQRLSGNVGATTEIVNHRNFPNRLKSRVLGYSIDGNELGLSPLREDHFDPQIWAFAKSEVEKDTVQGALVAPLLTRVRLGGELETDYYSPAHLEQIQLRGFLIEGGLRTTLLAKPNTRLVWNKAVSRIKGDPMFAPLTNICATKCAAEIDACVASVFGLIGGYSGYLGIHSPMEKYIPKSKFEKSPRILAQIIRQSVPLYREWHKRKPISQCAAKLFAVK